MRAAVVIAVTIVGVCACNMVTMVDQNDDGTMSMRFDLDVSNRVDPQELRAGEISRLTQLAKWAPPIPSQYGT